jgi:hypothetical protein
MTNRHEILFEEIRREAPGLRAYKLPRPAPSLQPNICETAAVETASVIISMMIAKSFIKLSAISLITLVPPCSYSFRSHTYSAMIVPTTTRRLIFIPRLSKPRLDKDLKISDAATRAPDPRGSRPLSVRGVG